MPNTILRLPAVLAATGDARSTFYRRIRDQLWTRPVQIGPRSVGWPEHEVAALNAARIAGLSVAEQQALVRQLEARRREHA